MDNQNATSQLSEIEKKVKQTRTATVVFGVIFLVVMTVVVCVSVFYIANLASTLENAVRDANATGAVNLTLTRNNLLSADYLAIVIPILVALAGSLVTFLGMNRLKMFDERIDKIRGEIADEINSRVQSEVAAGRGKFSDELMDKFTSKENKLGSAFDKCIESITSTAEQTKQDLEAQTKEFKNRYGWLEAIVNSNPDELNISTVADAHELTEKLQQEKPNGYIVTIKQIVDKVCAGQEPLSGDSSDYHNLSAELARGNMYYEAIRILEKGLSLFKTDTDLLSDIIEYATKNSQLDIARKAVSDLLLIKKEQWTWRCYEFIIDYYRAIGDYKNAQEMCKKFMDVLPYDDHAFRSYSEIEQIITPGEQGLNKAIDILEEALDKGVNGAQCAQSLADIYMKKGEYQNAINAASRAIMESAQSQPTIGIVGILSTRGFAYDRLFMKKMLDGNIELELAVKACADYDLAINIATKGLGTTSLIVIRQMIIRKTILEQYLK